MAKAIVDAGGWKADSVKRLREIFGHGYIFVFEPNPLLSYYYKDIPDCLLLNKAVWVEDTTLTFYYGKNKPGRSGSLILGKKDTTRSTTQVTAIDFDKWIKDTFKNDKIILKMDIEGAEYKVLDHMIKGGSINNLELLFIEWHYLKIPGVSEEEHNRIKSLIPCRVIEWE